MKKKITIKDVIEDGYVKIPLDITLQYGFDLADPHGQQYNCDIKVVIPGEFEQIIACDEFFLGVPMERWIKRSEGQPDIVLADLDKMKALVQKRFAVTVDENTKAFNLEV